MMKRKEEAERQAEKDREREVQRTHDPKNARVDGAAVSDKTKRMKGK